MKTVMTPDEIEQEKRDALSLGIGKAGWLLYACARIYCLRFEDGGVGADDVEALSIALKDHADARGTTRLLVMGGLGAATTSAALLPVM